MLKKILTKKRNGIAAITIVLLLGFLSLLSSTSIFTYNAWRWENLEISIKRENQQQAINSVSLYSYILLARQRNNTIGALGIFDTQENLAANILTNTTVSNLDTLSNCNTVSLPPAFDALGIKKITTFNQKENILINQICCSAGIYKSETESEVTTEELIHNYSKQRCKNFNWPNLRDSSSSLMSTTITP